DPETAATNDLGDSLEDWAAWLLADPDVNGAHAFAHAYMQANGPLPIDRRLLPRQFFVLGGEYAHDNLVPEDAAAAMRVRGPFAHATRDLPDGTRVKTTVE
ncbi:SMI1/KNR4 family protein, partial [Kitasatospora phosalacinea]